MTLEERLCYLDTLIAAADEQCEKLRISLGQAEAVLTYLRDARSRAKT